jgi:FHS family L-fucose permease-like MFS transporter
VAFYFFDLAIAGLGKNTGKASSFLIMMILGGGVIPPYKVFAILTSLDPNGMSLSWTHFSYVFILVCIFRYSFIAKIKNKGLFIMKVEGGSLISSN